jgi:phage shock protein E
MKFLLIIALLMVYSQAKTPSPINSARSAAQDTLWVDVRSPGEYQQEHLDSAINIPLQIIQSHINQIIPDTATVIGLYCRSGNRSGMALGLVQNMNYYRAFNAGGFEALKKQRK